MKKIVLSLAAAVVASLAFTAVASADTVDSDFESDSTIGQSVNGYDGWHVYDSLFNQSIVASPSGFGIGAKSLRFANTYTTDEFENQVYSEATKDAAGESVANHTFVGKFDIYSEGVQQGLKIGVAPDDGHGGRMSYVRFDNQTDGIHVNLYEVRPPYSVSEFTSKEIGVLRHGVSHNVRIELKMNIGPNNDQVRVYLDKTLAGTAKSWENYYRTGEHREPGAVNRLIFMARTNAGAALAGTTGYLFDNVSSSTSK